MERNKREKQIKSKETGIRRKNRINRHKKNSRRPYKIFFFCLVLFAAATVIALSLTVFFLVTEIRVEGNRQYSSEKIVEASGLQLSENLFRIDKNRAAVSIANQLPYVYQVHIRRKLPSQVIIEVTETTPVASIQGGENEVLIDIYGRALEVVLKGTKGSYPAIAGADVPTLYLGQGVFVKEQTQKNHTRLIEALLKAELLGGVMKIDLSVPYDLTFSYEDRILVTLGDLTDINEKMESFKFLLSEKIGQREAGELDITDPDEVHFIPQD